MHSHLVVCPWFSFDQTSEKLTLHIELKKKKLKSALDSIWTHVHSVLFFSASHAMVGDSPCMIRRLNRINQDFLVLSSIVGWVELQRLLPELPGVSGQLLSSPCQDALQAVMRVACLCHTLSIVIVTPARRDVDSGSKADIILSLDCHEMPQLGLDPEAPMSLSSKPACSPR